jgi:formylglycine-generating enzyme required for sulfatase activity
MRPENGREGGRTETPSEAPDETRLNGCGAGDGCPDQMNPRGDGFALTSPVGSFQRGATPDTGLLDLAGNVAEWLEVTESGQRFAAGGEVRSVEPSKVEATFREEVEASDRRPHIGFRCVSEPR